MIKQLRKIISICSVISILTISNVTPIYAFEYKNYAFTPAEKVIDAVSHEPLSVIDGQVAGDNPNIQITGLDYIPNNYKVNIQQKLEYDILDLVNQKRVENGLGTLQMDDRLLKLARYKSADMAQYKYFSHASLKGEYMFNWLEKLDMNYTVGAENIISNYPTIQPASYYVELWWNSPGHKKNMLNPDVKYTGIGAIYDDSNGKVYITQQFTK